MKPNIKNERRSTLPRLWLLINKHDSSPLPQITQEMWSSLQLLLPLTQKLNSSGRSEVVNQKEDLQAMLHQLKGVAQTLALASGPQVSQRMSKWSTTGNKTKGCLCSAFFFFFFFSWEKTAFLKCFYDPERATPLSGITFPPCYLRSFMNEFGLSTSLLAVGSTCWGLRVLVYASWLFELTDHFNFSFLFS